MPWNRMPETLIPIVLTCVTVLLLSNSCSCMKKEAGTGRRPRKSGVEIAASGDRLASTLYRRWFDTFQSSNANVRLFYQPSDASTSLTNFFVGTVDLVSTDTKPGRRSTDGNDGIIAFPVAASAVVAVFNLPDIHELKLSREAYVGIVLGRVQSWNDIPVRRYNRTLHLPDERIRLIIDGEPGPTAHAFSQHLVGISPEFAAKVGAGRLPPWPVGTRVNGEEAVSATVRATPYSLAFVDLISARRYNLHIARIQNWADNFVLPTTNSVLLTLSEAKYPRTVTAWAGDPKATDAYPLVRYIWLMCRTRYTEKEKQAVLGKLLDYFLAGGQTEAEQEGVFVLSSNILSGAKAVIGMLTPPEGRGDTGG
ncbi:MAG: substrate-binding domain-containing protein [Kiritimatiellae bacterium]|nr:substrate-binding domain-containing protein [Kiritimatiellia bacterium]